MSLVNQLQEGGEISHLIRGGQRRVEEEELGQAKLADRGAHGGRGGIVEIFLIRAAFKHFVLIINLRQYL